MARLYTNENFPEPAARHLRRLGHDVVTIQESGLAGQALTDDAVLAFATGEQRVLVTLNRRHFVRLHDERPGHAGFVVCSADHDLDRLAARIDEAVRKSPSLAGLLLRVNRPAQ